MLYNFQALFEAYKIPLSSIPQALNSRLPFLISDWLHNPELMNHYVLEENKDELCNPTFDLKESLRIAIKGANGKLKVELADGNDSSVVESVVDVTKIQGVFDPITVKEISLLESLVFFFRDVGAAGLRYDEFKGLNETFIHSYCSMLDFIHVELFQDADWDQCIPVESSSSLLLILQYLRTIFENLSSRRSLLLIIETISFDSFDQNHYAISRTKTFVEKLHGLLDYVVSNQRIYHEGFYQIVANLIYYPTLLNDHLRDRIKMFLISDCRLKTLELSSQDTFNPDVLQMLVENGSKDRELFQLLMELAEINVAEVRLYLVRFCIEKELDLDFNVK